MIINGKKIEKGDIFLYYGNDILSQCIQWFDNAKYSHAAIYLGNGKAQQSIRSGCDVVPFEETFLEYSEILIYRHKNVKEPGDIDWVLKRAEKLEGTPYDFLQIAQLAGIGLFRNIFSLKSLKAKEEMTLFFKKSSAKANLWFKNTDKRLHCAEFVYRCYHDALPLHTDPFEINVGFEVTMADGSINKKMIKNSLPSSTFEEFLIAESQVLNYINNGFGGKKDKLSSLAEFDFDSLLIQDRIEVSEYSEEEYFSEKANREFDDLLELIVQDKDQLEEFDKEIDENLQKSVLEFSTICGATNNNIPINYGFKKLNREQKIMSLANFLGSKRNNFVTSKDLKKSKSLYKITKINRRN